MQILNSDDDDDDDDDDTLEAFHAIGSWCCFERVSVSGKQIMILRAFHGIENLFYVGQ